MGTNEDTHGSYVGLYEDDAVEFVVDRWEESGGAGDEDDEDEDEDEDSGDEEDDESPAMRINARLDVLNTIMVIGVVGRSLL